MKSKHGNRRVLRILLVAIVAIIGVFLVLKALGDNKQLFKHPSDVVSPSFVQGFNSIRVGGLVVPGSLVKVPPLISEFNVIDFEDADETVPPLRIHYNKALPDLFRGGQGVVITGKLGEDGVFIASNILAKHDENYMPKMPEKTGSQN